MTTNSNSTNASVASITSTAGFSRTTGDVNAEAIKRLVILICDSKAHSRALLRSMLLQLGARSIYEVSDGAATLDAIRDVNPDVVIVDWDLPVVSTQDILSISQITSKFQNPSPPIIVVSNSGESSLVNEAVELGARQFLVRPISLTMLEQRLLGVVTAFGKIARANAARAYL